MTKEEELKLIEIHNLLAQFQAECQEAMEQERAKERTKKNDSESEE
jgi:hypothetical protein